MFNMLGAIAQFERELMVERQREGIAKAKAEGKGSSRIGAIVCGSLATSSCFVFDRL